MPISATSSIRHWLASLDALEALNPMLIVPSHYSTGPKEMIGTYRDYFTAVQTRVKALAGEGKTVDDINKMVIEELGPRYSHWNDPGRIQRAVDVAFREVTGF
jgi:hypothetical protein